MLHWLNGDCLETTIYSAGGMNYLSGSGKWLSRLIVCNCPDVYDTVCTSISLTLLLAVLFRMLQWFDLRGLLVLLSPLCYSLKSYPISRRATRCFSISCTTCWYKPSMFCSTFVITRGRDTYRIEMVGWWWSFFWYSQCPVLYLWSFPGFFNISSSWFSGKWDESLTFVRMGFSQQAEICRI